MPRCFSLKYLASLVLTATLTSFIMFIFVRDDCTCLTVNILVQKVRALQEEIRTKEDAFGMLQQPQQQQRQQQRRKGLFPSDAQRDDDEGDESRPDNWEGWDPHVLCLLVPFRDRFEELMEFVPYMDTFLTQQRVRHKIFVINQIDSYRASLLNIGYKESAGQCSYIGLHDVDLLPRNPAITYDYAHVKDGPHHVASPSLHPRYHYKEFIGGIMLMKSEHFEMLNGLSNHFWGWGREDDEFYMRITEAGLKLSRPTGINTGTKTFFHIHDKKTRKRDMKRYGTQHKESFKRDNVTGLDNVVYQVRTRQRLTVGSAVATLLHVKLECDTNITPWCVQEQN